MVIYKFKLDNITKAWRHGTIKKSFAKKNVSMPDDRKKCHHLIQIHIELVNFIYVHK